VGQRLEVTGSSRRRGLMSSTWTGTVELRRVDRARAAVVTGGRRAEVREVDLPRPAPHEVRVRLEGCGVCGSNLPVWEGREWFEYPLEPGAPGHEGWGMVDATGTAVTNLKAGDRVASLGAHAFAEYDVVSASAVIPIPEALSDQPFPGEALGCAMNVFRRSDIEAGQTVAIIGIGFLGALLTQLAERAGAHVIALSRRPFALDIARQCGAHETLALDDHQRIIGRVRDLTEGRFCDRVIEAVGMQWPLDLAGELTRERGRLVIGGFHQDGPRQVNMFLWNWRGLDVINAHERDPAAYVTGMRAAAQAVASGTLDPSMLYTHTFALDQVDAALNAMRERPDGFLKALVVP
jgi:threonine dehydrogenase-like Zn-dependent dehydrogenase